MIPRKKQKKDTRRHGEENRRFHLIGRQQSHEKRKTRRLSKRKSRKCGSEYN
jgi:hypothetical protein